MLDIIIVFQHYLAIKGTPLQEVGGKCSMSSVCKVDGTETIFQPTSISLSKVNYTLMSSPSCASSDLLADVLWQIFIEADFHCCMYDMHYNLGCTSYINI